MKLDTKKVNKLVEDNDFDEDEEDDTLVNSSPSASPNVTRKLKQAQEITPTSTNSAIVRTKHGAQFTYDPITKQVTLITPSGRTHILRLPMIAIIHMFGLSEPNPSTSPSPLVTPSPSPSAIPSPSPSALPSPTPAASATPSPSISPSPTPQATESAQIAETLFTETTNTAGEPVLTQIVFQKMKFLGIIPVNIPTTITINEVSGEVQTATNSKIVKALAFLFKI